MGFKMKARCKLCISMMLLFSATVTAGDWSVEKSWQVRSEHITFESEGYRLSGTLYWPSDAENVAAVVIPQQAGTELRSYVLFQQKVRVFNALGYAAFVYDRRGAGESEGPATRPSYEALAADAVAAKHSIAEHAAINAEQVGFWGQSQSGWISMLAANQSDAAFVIVVSSPLTTPEEQMDVMTYNYVQHLYGSEIAEKALRIRQTLMTDYFDGRVSYAEAQALIRSVEQEPWFDFLYVPSADEFPQDIANSPWQAWLAERVFDPLQVAKALSAPTLFMLGGADLNIPVQRTLDLIDEHNLEERVDVVVIPRADHVMRPFREPGERAGEPFNGAESPEYFVHLAAWLINTVGDNEVKKEPAN